MAKSSVSIQSFYPIEDVTTGILELNKKRKCLYGLELPCPKHKFGARSSHSGQGSSAEQNFKVDEGPNNIMKDNNCSTNIPNETEQNEESAKDGDSSIDDDYGSVMILDDDKIIQQSSMQTNQVNQHSKSLGSCDNTQKEKIDEMADFDSSSAKSIDIDGQQQELEHYKVEAYENVMLYSNGVTANESLFFPDARLKPAIDQEFDQYSNGVSVTANESLPFPGVTDARLNIRKPTIDQEFEQYFSRLML